MKPMKVVASGGYFEGDLVNPNHKKMVQDSIPQIYHSLTVLGVVCLLPFRLL